MRKRLAQVLERDDQDEPMDAVVRRFWSTTTSRSTPHRPHPKVVVRKHAGIVVREHAKVVVRKHTNVADLAQARQARAAGRPLRVPRPF